MIMGCPAVTITRSPSAAATCPRASASSSRWPGAAADPAILLLDEATAALDLAAEATVNHAISQLTAARTTIVVAHRLTTAARADRIVVMDSGGIAEAGTHAETARREEHLRRLWDAFTGESELVA